MNSIISFFVGLSLGFLYFSELYSAISVGIFLFLFYRVVFESNESFVFREWVLMLYALNYLLAPAITYTFDQSTLTYPMKIPLENYFQLALPGFLLFSAGMYSLKTGIFSMNFKGINKAAVTNETFLLRVTQVGLALRIFSFVFPGEIGFIVYLLSMVRYVGAFSLFSINKKYWIWPAIVLLHELANAFIAGMYHDAVMWIVFFGIFYVFSKRPTLQLKLLGISGMLLLILFIQGMKSIYRSAIGEGGQAAGLSTAATLGGDLISDDAVLSEDNLLGTLNRGNQAWILASTIQNMDRTQNFQELNNVKLYLESALLPRFLAPNKLVSGDKGIFNAFSGHEINSSTSMGLGVFADGYISYGATGLYVFGYCLGLLFAITFKLVERWSKISPFYILLLLPMLNYAVRPDCELQTTLNHLSKSLLLYGILVSLTKFRFSLKSKTKQRKLFHLTEINAI